MKKILFVQSGDYREASLNLQKGGPETFRDQKRSVDFVSELTPASKVATLALGQKEYPWTELAPNLWAAARYRDAVSKPEIAKLFDYIAPMYVVLRTPHLGILQEAARRGAYVLPCFADIFGRGGPKGRGGPRTAIRNFLFRRALIRCKTPCFANHNLNASRSLVEVVGLPADKVVPWDWSKIPLSGAVKSAVADKTRPTAFFAGALIEDKGVGDCLEAVARLKTDSVLLHMTFAGGGNLDHWRARAKALGLSDQITFQGVIPNEEVRRQMARHDFVVVPSRHSYPEGMPNTIYEALASQSVLVISDHPAFKGRLTPNEQALVFRAADANALARRLREAIEDQALYKKISVNARSAHDALYAGIEWTELVETFLADPENRRGWVEKYSLNTLAD